MTITPENQPHTPRLQIDIDEILAGTAFAAAHICDECQVPVTILIIDIKRLIEEISRLQAALVGERLISANLRAAIRAALGAEADGEPDPLTYLRDEMPYAGDPRSEWGGPNDAA
jgi:hypothetical protein